MNHEIKTFPKGTAKLYFTDESLARLKKYNIESTFTPTIPVNTLRDVFPNKPYNVRAIGTTFTTISNRIVPSINIANKYLYTAEELNELEITQMINEL